MDRTAEFRRLTTPFKASERQEEDSAMVRLLGSAKELKETLQQSLLSIDRATSSEYAEIEKSLSVTLPQAQEVVALLKEAASEENFLFVDGVTAAITLAVQKIELKAEDKRHKRRKTTLNVALEPEKAPATVKHHPGMMQLLHEENERILEKVQYSEKEVLLVRRKISEIDTLQRLISQELFSQDERIDVLLNKTSTASIDVKISRTYLKNAGEKRKTVRQFLSLLILILAMMILLLHFSR